MSLRTAQRILIAGLLLGFLPAGLTARDRGRGRDDEESLRPEKQPSVNEKQLEGFRKSNREIAELYDQVQQGIDELTAKIAEAEQTEPKNMRKLERKIAGLRSGIARDRRKLEKLLKKKIAPVEKEYLAVKKKHDALEAKAKALEEKGDQGRAQKAHQEAAKLTGSMGGQKRTLDLLYYHTFFKGEEVLKEGEE